MSENATAEETQLPEADVKHKSAIEALSLIIGSLPSRLDDPDTLTLIATNLRQPASGTGDDKLCHWLYDTFQSEEPDLRLIVIGFIPMITGIYLHKAVFSKPLAGFEAVLLAIYGHVTRSREGQPITVNLPDLSYSSIYHEENTAGRNIKTPETGKIYSPVLEPHSTIRATKRARIVAVALELYSNEISKVPEVSKFHFCEFCSVWAGHDCEKDDEDLSSESLSPSRGKFGVPLPWELLQPIMRILGHCILGFGNSKKLKEVASSTLRNLYVRMTHEVNPNGILAAGSLLRLAKRELDSAELDFSVLGKLQGTDSLVISL